MIGLPDNADFQTFVSGCFPLHKMLMKRRLRFFSVTLRTVLLIKLEKASTHTSAKTHTSVFVTRDFDFDLITPK